MKLYEIVQCAVSTIPVYRLVNYKKKTSLIRLHSIQLKLWKLLPETLLIYKKTLPNKSTKSNIIPPSVHLHKTPVKPNIECYRCGGHHYTTKCQIINADCRSCGKKGHLAKVCISQPKSRQTTTSRGQ